AIVRHFAFTMGPQAAKPPVGYVMIGNRPDLDAGYTLCNEPPRPILATETRDRRSGTLESARPACPCMTDMRLLNRITQRNAECRNRLAIKPRRPAAVGRGQERYCTRLSA